MDEKFYIAEDRIAGCLFGLALGDAMGAPTEFLKVPEILRRWPPDGPRELHGEPILVTDDTQMMLAVGEALTRAVTDGPLRHEDLEKELRLEFIKWMHSPDNNRAPGMTCLRSCAGLEAGKPWYEATSTGSKGCGANMRVAPVGLLPRAPAELAALAQFQAALTHGHATALAASDLTAAAIADLGTGGDPATLIDRLREYAESQRTVYHPQLGPLAEICGFPSAEEYIARGWTECLQVLQRLEEALRRPVRDKDPCEATGEGWIAEEALATGLLSFLLYPEDPVAAIRRGAVTSGDSDSIACLAGAFAGAHLGISAWPEDWVKRIEYRERIIALSEALAV